MEDKVKEYETRLRQRVGEGEYERHREIVILLARNLAIEDVLWEEILVHIVRDIHTEFRALNIEIPSVMETKSEAFMDFLGDLGEEDASEERDEGTESSDIRDE